MTLEGLLNEVEYVATFAARQSTGPSGDATAQLEKLTKSVTNVEKQLADLVAMVKQLTGACPVAGVASVACPAKAGAPAAAKAPAKPAKDDDDLDDLFDDDEVDAEAEALRQKRLAEYAAKKSKKPAVVAKSSIVLDVKPWDDETDLEVMQEKVKSIQMDGLIWGAAKFVPLAYGIKKLQIMCVVEDDKVSIDELTEKIEEFEDLVQSVDIAAFNKV